MGRQLICILFRKGLLDILKPKEVHGEDFPSKTFRVMKKRRKVVCMGSTDITSRAGGVEWSRARTKDKFGYVYDEDFSGEPVRVVKEKKIM